MELTAKEIAEDVQQTFDGVSTKYIKILEERIKNYEKQYASDNKELTPDIKQAFEYCYKMSNQALELYKEQPYVLKSINEELYTLINENKNWLTNKLDNTYNIHKIHIHMAQLNSKNNEILNRIEHEFKSYCN